MQEPLVFAGRALAILSAALFQQKILIECECVEVDIPYCESARLEVAVYSSLLSTFLIGNFHRS